MPTGHPHHHHASPPCRAARCLTTSSLEHRQIQNELKATKKKTKLLEKEVSWAQRFLLHRTRPPSPPLDRFTPTSPSAHPLAHPSTHAIFPRRRQLYVEIKLKPVDSTGQPIRFGWDRHRETCEILSTTKGGQADLAGKLRAV